MSDMGKAEQDQLKRVAAEAAVADLENGIVLGLGTGSTAAIALEALAERVAKGLRVACIPTSEHTAARARELGVPLTSFAECRRIDVTMDGADEVEVGSLNLIKGLGGALLREKIVASASKRMLVVVDESKLVDRLGQHAPVPVEIVAFGWQVTLDRLADLGGRPTLRMAGDEPYLTDSGNHIADCAFGEIGDPAGLERRLAAITGVVESGLFIGLAARVVVGTRSGMRVLER